VDKPLFLISCVSEKGDAPAPARDLYRSDWFRKAVAYAEAVGSEFLILSAEHGVVAPSDVIEPYERSLTKMGTRDRDAWARRVVAQLQNRKLGERPTVLLAGERYRHPFLVWYLGLLGSVSAPMAGLGIGQQKAWLIAAAAERREP
jgi:hypothetical protein